MKIPKTFVLGGTTWVVEQVETLPGCMGLCNNQEAKISILKSLNKDVKEQTFFHELIHAIMFSMGKPGESHNEEFVDGFGTFLHQFQLTNK